MHNLLTGNCRQKASNLAAHRQLEMAVCVQVVLLIRQRDRFAQHDPVDTITTQDPVAMWQHSKAARKEMQMADGFGNSRGMTRQDTLQFPKVNRQGKVSGILSM